MSDKIQNPVVILNNVRLSYPSIWKPKVNKEDPSQKPKYEATAILDKVANAKDIANCKAAIELCKKSPVMKGKKPASVALRDGADTEARAEAEGYGPGVMSVGARSKKKPRIVGRNREDLAEEDGRPFAGCFVNMGVEFYPFYHAKKGYMVCASLRSIQFVKDGPAFGEKPVDAEKEFEDLGETNENVDNEGSDFV